MRLKSNVCRLFRTFSLSEKKQERIFNLLDLLDAKDPPTYDHCERISLISLKASEELNFDQKAVFYGSLLHDIGKISIDSYLLKKTKNFTAEDMEKMEPHVTAGYLLLQEDFWFSSMICLMHHYFQKNSYPDIKDFKKTVRPEKIKPETMEKVEKCARLVSIIDKYDAMRRVNDRTIKSSSQFDSKKALINEFKRDDRYVEQYIFRLYNAGIFK
jgi:putative nucleotidyltransferase with HDIG domain